MRFIDLFCMRGNPLVLAMPTCYFKVDGMYIGYLKS